MGEVWSSRLSFWVALVSSAVGLGNIWRFSYLLAEYGSMFLLLYAVALFAIGVPMLCLELLLASKTKKEPVRALFEKEGGIFKKWPLLIGALFFTLGSYYAVIVAETLNYAISLHLSPALFLVWALTLVAVFKGIEGIEKANNLLMFLLVVFLLYLFFNVSPALGVLLNLPSTSPFLEVLGAAVAQVLFSLSVGAGMTYTYSTYVGRSYSISRTAFVVAVADVAIALIASAVIFSLPVDKSMLVAFDSLASLALSSLGGIGAAVLFLALFSAGLTSLIAIVKVVYDNWGKRVVWGQFLFSLVLGLLLPELIKPLDQYVVTYLFLLMLPVNAFFFYRLAVHRPSEG